MTIPEKKEIIETLSQFKAKLDYAKMEGDEWVETTPEIINYFNRNGLGDAGYYIHEGIKVCLIGTRDKIIEKESQQMDRRLHGETEGVVEGR